VAKVQEQKQRVRELKTIAERGRSSSEMEKIVSGVGAGLSAGALGCAAALGVTFPAGLLLFPAVLPLHSLMSSSSEARFAKEVTGVCIFIGSVMMGVVTVSNSAVL
jgi:hypothetical protein